MKTEKSQIKRLYIMPEVWVTVTHSQVFNWIRLINQNGISTDCLSITERVMKENEVEEIEKNIGGNFIEVHDFKRLILSDAYITLTLFKFYLSNFFKFKKIVFQTRLDSLGITYRLLKYLPKAKFIFEARAAGNEERVHHLSEKKDSMKLKIKNYFAEMNESLLIRESDKIICVSNTLKKYFIEKHQVPENKFIVFPGAADSELFYFNASLRTVMRNELGLKPTDILIVYSGRLEMKWEIPDKIFSFFMDLLKKNPHFKLLLATPDIDIANHYISENNLISKVLVRTVKLSGVNGLLNASDVGLLLREDIPMNHVASPTKFAEYLMCGLPVIISHGVRDFAELTDQTGFGVVVKYLDGVSASEYDKLVNAMDCCRQEISKWGTENLSKEVYIEKYVYELQKI